MAVTQVRNPARDDPPTPSPLRERPPDDRFCDLILNGGVASGVVYPWALLELARHYRFRSIGGNSVGAMAAALAAAAEYGRCSGNPNAFEALRRVPLQLAEEKDGRTLMLRLFQPAAGVRRLFEAFLSVVRRTNGPAAGKAVAWLLGLWDVLELYGLVWWLIAGALLMLLPAMVVGPWPLPWLALLAATAGLLAAEQLARNRARDALRARLLLALAALLVLAHVYAICIVHSILLALGALALPLLVVALWLARLRPELRALQGNGYGLCSGRAQPDADGRITQKALVEWLHEGIQRSAGREREDPPLTFADLWNAPRPATQPAPGGERFESISLHMFSTNVTLARPVAWPLADRAARLFFRKCEWERFFPPTLLNALCNAAVKYAPAGDGDPQTAVPADLLELPAGGMPIAVAARLSLSFPLLFSCIPVYAIDYEGEHGRRVLRPCQLTDGGLCTNFPIHLFDAAHPRWPTFGMMLSRRIKDYHGDPVWLPKYHLDGRADNWSRDVPGAKDPPPAAPLEGLRGLLFGMLTSALDWNDNLISRLPHVRNRVLRMALKPGEGHLNIAMPRATILSMAHEYGTLGGLELARRFVSPPSAPTAAWQEHLYVRALNQVRALAEHLRGYGQAVTAAGFNKPLADILADAQFTRPLRTKPGRANDPLGECLSPGQATALQHAVESIAALEQSLRDLPDFGPYEPVPGTKLMLRSRI